MATKRSTAAGRSSVRGGIGREIARGLSKGLEKGVSAFGKGIAGPVGRSLGAAAKAAATTYAKVTLAAAQKAARIEENAAKSGARLKEMAAKRAARLEEVAARHRAKLTEQSARNAAKEMRKATGGGTRSLLPKAGAAGQAGHAGTGFGKVLLGGAAGLGAALFKPLMDAANRRTLIRSLEGELGRGGAEKAVGISEKFAAETPFGTGEVNDATKDIIRGRLAGVDDLEATLRKIGDAAAASGDPDAFHRIIRALRQMKDLGKVTAEEMNQLTEAGVPAFDLLAQATGKSVAELRKMMQGGKVLSGDVVPKLIDAMGNRFGGTMKRMSEELPGRWEAFVDSVKKAVRPIGEELLPVVQRWLSASAEIVANLGEWIQRNAGLAKNAALAAMALGLFGAAAFLVGTAVVALGAVITGTTTIFGALLSPVGLTVIALTAVAGAAAYLASEVGVLGGVIDWLKGVFGPLWETAKTAFQGVKDALSAAQFRLAGEILWAGLKAAFLRGKAEVLSIWDDLTSQLKYTFQGVTTYLGILFRSWTATITRQVLTLLASLQEEAAALAEKIPGMGGQARSLRMGAIASRAAAKAAIPAATAANRAAAKDAIKKGGESERKRKADDAARRKLADDAEAELAGLTTDAMVAASEADRASQVADDTKPARRDVIQPPRPASIDNALNEAAVLGTDKAAQALARQMSGVGATDPATGALEKGNKIAEKQLDQQKKINDKLDKAPIVSNLRSA